LATVHKCSAPAVIYLENFCLGRKSLLGKSDTNFLGKVGGPRKKDDLDRETSRISNCLLELNDGIVVTKMFGHARHKL
jgi:hypothetical protein